MNKQAVFDTVATHLITQGVRSTYSEGGQSVGAPISAGNCLYRGDCNTKCAIGALIKDEHYSENLERNGVSEPHVIKAVEKSLNTALDYPDVDFLSGLQLIHDSYIPESWPQKLREYAKKHNLQVPACVPEVGQ